MEDAGQSISDKLAAGDEKPSESGTRRSRSRSGDADAERSCKRQAVERTVQEDTLVETASAQLKKIEAEANGELPQATDLAPSKAPEEEGVAKNLDTEKVDKSAEKTCDTTPSISKSSEHSPQAEDVLAQTEAKAGSGKTSRERSRSRDAPQVPQSQDAIKSSGDAEKKASSDGVCSQPLGVKVPEPPVPLVAALVPPVPKPPVQVPRPVIPTSPMSRPVIPPVPQAALPERTRLVVTVPVKVQTRVDTTLGDMRKQLLSGGCLQSAGSFYIKGDNNPLEDTTKIGNLSDVRLLLSSEASLQPWQLCLAHRTGQQLVLRANSMNNTMSLEAMLSKNPFYKTKMCNNWVQNNGRCIRGSRCVYAHGQSDMRPPVPAAMLPHALQMQAAAMRPGMPPAMFAGMLRPGGLPITPAVPQPSEPEVVFTVDEVEEKKRAERARRFAPKDKASFEREDKDAKSKPEETPAATPGNSCAVTESKEDNDASFQLPLPPMPPIGMLPGADGSVAMTEEEIADYLLDMQQQFIHTLDPCDGDLPPNFPMPEFPPPGAGLGLSPPGVPLPEPPIPPLTMDSPPTQESVLDGTAQLEEKTTQEGVPPTQEPVIDAEGKPETQVRLPDDVPPPQESFLDAVEQMEAKPKQPEDVQTRESAPDAAESREAKATQPQDAPQESVPDDAAEQPEAQAKEPEDVSLAQKSAHDPQVK